MRILLGNLSRCDAIGDEIGLFSRLSAHRVIIVGLSTILARLVGALLAAWLHATSTLTNGLRYIVHKLAHRFAEVDKTARVLLKVSLAIFEDTIFGLICDQMR